ncbi:MAG: M2 family metallopeptidase [Bryobacteraceae bacterium]|nr:M2 family metallopeptidase [Bryobacteraceae bacterium]
MRFATLLLFQLLTAGAFAQTEQDARRFLEEAEQQLLRLSEEASRAQWVQATYITHDTEILAAQASEKLAAATADLAKKAAKFANVKLPAELERKLTLLRVGITLPAPADPKLSEELTRLVTGMESTYGRGRYCPPNATGDKCLDLQQIERVMRESRDPRQLLEVWQGWRTVSPPMRDDYRRFVEISNQGAKELGFRDTGALWRSKYDMPPDEFAKEVDRLWEQVKPLYVSLHTYVRRKLRDKYGPGVVPERGPIPAHLLGNPWAQSWDNVYDLVAPANADPGFDLTEILKARKVDAREMVRIGERFFTSLGFAPLPKTFWERSLFTKPQDREVVCHASAWDVDNVEDLRIKMCIDITGEEFAVVHHELGHNFYQRAYNKQPLLFRDSANDGFHEAIGDTIALSITPEYLVKLGFLKQAPDPGKDIGLLLRRALEKVSFLPFGILIDQWRWKVFSGEVAPDRYNAAWWELRQKYQGVSAPVARSEKDFDPGAKYHVPANVPYTRYFLAHVLQFQFHRALAQTAGCREPLHRCSVYGSAEAGKRLQAMLELGASRPWQEALFALTGQRQMDATAMRDYFAPLQKWLDEQNKGQSPGW